MNLDLMTGGFRSLFSFQGHIGWSGAALLVYDETTLGAAILRGAQFDRVTAQQLASAVYGQGAANPALAPADVPPGSVLAVRVETHVYAKITVLAYGPRGDVELRWVAYRTSKRPLAGRARGAGPRHDAGMAVGRVAPPAPGDPTDVSWVALLSC